LTSADKPSRSPSTPFGSPAGGLFGWFRVGPAQDHGHHQADTTTGALWATLKADAAALTSLAALATLVVLHLATLLSPELAVAAFLPFLQAARLALAVLVLRAGLMRVIQQEERRLWRGIATALACQLGAALLEAVFPGLPLAVRLLGDALLAASYLALVMAVERPIPRRRGLQARDFGPTFHWSGGTVFVIGLLFYFNVVPLLANFAVYESLLPSSYLAVVLDVYVAFKLYYFGRTTDSPRWRMLYSLLLLAMTGFLAGHLLQTLERMGRLGGVWAELSDLFWNVPFVLLVLATRLRYHPFPTQESLFDSVNRKDPLPWPQERLVVFALAFPLIHLLFHSLGLMDEPSTAVRETFVLVWLLLFGAMALVQQRLLEKKARSLWMERMRAEEALTKSHESLRLATERAEAEEALRKSEEKFNKAFRAIPDSMLISTLAEGHILEVNDGFERQFGYRRDEVLGKTGVELELWVEPEDRAMMTRILRERGMVRNLEFELTTKSGERRLTLLSAEIIDLEGETCLLMVLRDITERQEMAPQKGL
jgi:PAS domain S-box-containing protein